MSTITRRLLWALPLVLIAWIGVMALVMRFSDVAPAAVVLFPDDTLMAALPEETAILAIGSASLTLVNRPGLAGELYAAGALLVLPAGLTGCLPLTKEIRKKL